MKSANPIRVVVVDDSMLIRQVLKRILEEADDIEVVATAQDANVAREAIRETNPDVVTLDIEMPGMNGLDFLERLMRLKPTPVIMISTLTVQGAEATLTALERGAVDFHPKPTINVGNALQEYAEEIREKVRNAAQARVQPRRAATISPPAVAPTASAGFWQDLIVIGASTGGTEAIREVLEGLVADTPPILIVQHMPAGFTKTFAARLDKLCPMRVTEAVSGMPLLRGHAYLAPGSDTHLLLGETGGKRTCILSNAVPVNRHRPSVDVLFQSVAAHPLAKRTSAALLTGMGKDGALGLLALRGAGAHTVAQNEETCVVYGMPREAVNIGAAEEIKPLQQIAASLMQRTRKGPTN